MIQPRNPNSPLLFRLHKYVFHTLHFAYCINSLCPLCVVSKSTSVQFLMSIKKKLKRSLCPWQARVNSFCPVLFMWIAEDSFNHRQRQIKVSYQLVCPADESLVLLIYDSWELDINLEHNLVGILVCVCAFLLCLSAFGLCFFGVFPVFPTPISCRPFHMTRKDVASPWWERYHEQLKSRNDSGIKRLFCLPSCLVTTWFPACFLITSIFSSWPASSRNCWNVLFPPTPRYLPSHRPEVEQLGLSHLPPATLEPGIWEHYQRNASPE